MVADAVLWRVEGVLPACQTVRYQIGGSAVARFRLALVFGMITALLSYLTFFSSYILVHFLSDISPTRTWLY